MGFGFDDVLDVAKDFLDPVSVVSGGWYDLDSAQGLWDSFTGKDQQRDANRANVQSAREQMMFQERMSNTAHQRQVRDLKAAGLNPVLSGNAGASVPSGAMATVSPVPSGTRAAVSSAFDLRQQIQDQRVADQGIRTSQSVADVNSAQAVKTLAEADATTGGLLGRWAGTDVSNLVRRIIKTGAHSARGMIKSMPSFQKFRSNEKRKKYIDDFEKAIFNSGR